VREVNQAFIDAAATIVDEHSRPEPTDALDSRWLVKRRRCWHDRRPGVRRSIDHRNGVARGAEWREVRRTLASLPGLAVAASRCLDDRSDALRSWRGRAN
jgi:hypothetical protein